MVAVAITLAPAVGCGTSSDGSGTTASPGQEPTTTVKWPYTVDDYVAELEDQPGGLTDVMDETETKCFVGTIVESIGLDRLEEAGATPERLAASDDFEGLLSEEDGRRVTIDGLVNCTDFHELVQSQAELPAADAQCLRDGVEERALAEVLLGSSSGEFEPTPESMATYEAATSMCPGAMQALGAS